MTFPEKFIFPGFSMTVRTLHQDSDAVKIIPNSVQRLHPTPIFFSFFFFLKL